jgi:Kdo2-lipid IVA lauroyltransferase/acyltransferase
LNNILYYLSLPFLYLLSVLPFRVLYAFSDFVCFLLYNVIGYRKEVVLKNLRNSFPDKSEKEILAICNKFYSYLCDLTIETFKTLTITPKKMKEHCSLAPEALALFNKYYDEKRSVIIVLGHYGNWEWAGNAFSLCCKQQLNVIYHPLSNPKFNRLIYNMRTRFGTGLIAMNNVFKEMLRNRDKLSATAFIADQTPSHQNVQWLTFLNQETAVFKGTEVIARKMNLPVIYISIFRIKRGFYEMQAHLISDAAATTPDGEITELHTRCLERDINLHPELWLWSHKRWKLKRQP